MMIGFNRWRYRTFLITLALLLALLALHPLLRIAVLNCGGALSGSQLTAGKLVTSLRHGKIAVSDVVGGSKDGNLSPQFKADQIALELNRLALAQGQVLVRRGYASGLHVSLPRLAPASVGPAAAGPSTSGQTDRHRTVSSWLAYARRELSARAPGSCSSSKLAQDIIGRWTQSLDETERRALAARERLRELHHATDLVGDNPLRNSGFYAETTASLEQIAVELFEVRGEIERWRQQAEMDRESVRAAAQQDLEAASQAAAPPDTETLTRFLLDNDLEARIRTAITWLGWSRQFLPTYYRTELRPDRRGRQIAFVGRPARPDILVESLAFRGTASSPDATYQLEGTISGLSSHPDRSEHPTEIVLHTTGQTETIVHVTLDACDGPLSERLVVHCPRCPIGERKLGNPALLAVVASPGICHYRLDLEQHAGRLRGTLSFQQPVATFAPCFTKLLESSELAAVVTDAMRNIGSLQVDAELSGTWEHPQWSVQSNLGTELAEHLASQLQARNLAFHRSELDRVMVGLEAQLTARQEMCVGRCDRIVASLQTEDGEIERLRATVASRLKESDAVRHAKPSEDLIRR